MGEIHDAPRKEPFPLETLDGDQNAKKRKITKSQKKDGKPKFHCTYFMKSKNRSCKMMRRESEKYCPAHIIAATEEQKNNNGGDSEELGTESQRIPCPLDPSHSIWERNLKSHVKKCNKTKAIKEPETKSWFRKNFNSCSSEAHKEASESNNLDTKSEDYYKYWIPVVEKAFANLISILQAQDASFSEILPLENKSGEGESSSVIKSRFKELGNQKHIIQQSSLISHLIENGLYGNDKDYIEFGCGRAELSRYLAKDIVYRTLCTHKDQLDDVSMPGFLLIDRSGSRMKMDSKIAKDYMEVRQSIDLSTSNTKSDVASSELSKLAPFVLRLKTDIKDLYLDDVLQTPQFQKISRKFVGISKHLCGCATDLTLQCILNAKTLETQFGGLVVAMCCRHVCDYSMFLPDSKRFLSQIFECSSSKLVSIFNVLTKLVSWATNGRRPGMADDDINNHPSNLTVLQREALGLKARRIIDECRVFAMREKGYNVKIARYVESDISLENVCMIVIPKNEDK
ncbi:tRNA:m4X modification enzyme [Saccharomycopsis crataegensis]|uniref:tRNA:m(4)X modification enzyme TRM13 n=1 Tax=Saccharomycopsis crataegensis TaxID=43959 RepID=A0AAV5QG89_9ASCO|nr:tRNA:m4X modification enzyme [Saccharomycopsis crataegensis]